MPKNSSERVIRLSRKGPKLIDLTRGEKAFSKKGHTLILGWSSRIFPILEELAIANQNVKKPLVVVLSALENSLMRDQIQSRTQGLGNLRILLLSADPTNPLDLLRVNTSGAKSVIVLDPDSSGDASVVATVLAIKSIDTNPSLNIVAELDDVETAEALVTAFQGRVIPVLSHDLIARVTAQASRQPGLSEVILDLLDFAGDEIYFTAIPALEGRSYGDALLSFNTASVIGLQLADSSVLLNPKANTKIQKGSRVIAIAQDDDKVHFTGIREELVTKSSKIATPAAKPEHILIIGWSQMGKSVLAELFKVLAKGSTVHIIAQKNLVAAEQLVNLGPSAGVKVTTASVSGDRADLAVAAKAKQYSQVIVLGYRNFISPAEADAQTMLTMVQLNRLFQAENSGVSPTRLVAELLDGRKVDVARVAAGDDLVVSDHLAALLMAQLSENPALAPVFDEFFDAEGAGISIRSVSLYSPVGTQVSYAQLVANARDRGESAIGFRVGGEHSSHPAQGVMVNPDKDTMFTPTATDGLVVVSATR